MGGGGGKYNADIKYGGGETDQLHTCRDPGGDVWVNKSLKEKRNI